MIAMLLFQGRMPQPDVYELLALFLIIDGLLTIINLCVLGLTLKLYTEWNKVWRMTRKGE